MPARQNLQANSNRALTHKDNSDGSVQKQKSSLKRPAYRQAGNPTAVQSEEKELEAEVRTFLSWKSPSRPFKRRETEFFKTLGAILFLVSVVLLFFKEWLLIMAIGAFYFITYVLSRFPPEDIGHKITTQGITTDRRVYLWRELSDFWFTQSFSQTVLNVEVLPTGKFRLAGRLFILLGNEKEEKVKELLAQYLSYREIPEKNWLDDASAWLAKKVPLERN